MTQSVFAICYSPIASIVAAMPIQGLVHQKMTVLHAWPFAACPVVGSTSKHKKLLQFCCYVVLDVLAS